MEIKRALIIDTETTSLEDSARVVEVGAILYDLESQTSLQEMSTLLPGEDNEAEPINRIKPDSLRRMAEVGCSCALELLFAMSKKADVFVAHNAEFDRARVFGKPDFLPLADLPWVDTMDMKWPLATREQSSLINLALDHGIGVASAHRALTDCRLIAALFDRMADLQRMFQYAMRPTALYQALVSYEDKELAKQRGFRWDPVKKIWTRRMAIADAEQLNFKTRRLDQAA
jgi:DNA polymerase III subunit epsilon